MRRAKSVPVRLNEEDGDAEDGPRDRRSSITHALNVTLEEWERNDEEGQIRRERLFAAAKRQGGVVGESYIRLIKKEVERLKRLNLLPTLKHGGHGATMAQQQQPQEEALPAAAAAEQAASSPVQEQSPRAADGGRGAFSESFRKKGAAFKQPATLQSGGQSVKFADGQPGASTLRRAATSLPAGLDSLPLPKPGKPIGRSNSSAIPTVGETPSSQRALDC